MKAAKRLRLGPHTMAESPSKEWYGPHEFLLGRRKFAGDCGGSGKAADFECRKAVFGLKKCHERTGWAEFAHVEGEDPRTGRQAKIALSIPSVPKGPAQEHIRAVREVRVEERVWEGRPIAEQPALRDIPCGTHKKGGAATRGQLAGAGRDIFVGLDKGPRLDAATEPVAQGGTQAAVWPARDEDVIDIELRLRLRQSWRVMVNKQQTERTPVISMEDALKFDPGLKVCGPRLLAAQPPTGLVIAVGETDIGQRMAEREMGDRTPYRRARTLRNMYKAHDPFALHPVLRLPRAPMRNVSLAGAGAMPHCPRRQGGPIQSTSHHNPSGGGAKCALTGGLETPPPSPRIDRTSLSFLSCYEIFT